MLKANFIKIFPFLVTGVICFALGFLADQGFEKYRQERLLTSDERVMEELSRMIILPEEIPSIATVSDKEKLLDQPFFTQAENGDKVIIYKTSRRAYLFRPSEKKIIDMTVIAIEAPQSETIPTFETPGQ